MIDLAGATRIFEKPLNMGILFDTLDILGTHSGTPELCSLLIIAGLCAESQTKKTQAPHPFAIFVLPQNTHRDVSVSSFDVPLTR